MKVKLGNGTWALPNGKYMPGELFKPLRADGDWLLDGTYHAADIHILELLGVYGRPTKNELFQSENWFKKYRSEATKRVVRKAPLPLNVQDQIQFGEPRETFGPLDLLPDLSDSNRIALTNFLLENTYNTKVVVRHPRWKSNQEMRTPELWWVRIQGLVDSSLGAVPPKRAFYIEEDQENIDDVVPVVKNSKLESPMARAVGMKDSITALEPADFQELVAFHRQRDSEASVGKSYSWWCYVHPETAPHKFHVRNREEWQYLLPEEIVVTSDPEAEENVEGLGFPALLVPEPEDSINLSRVWGLVQSHDIPVEFEFEEIEEPQALSYKFRGIYNYVVEEDPDEIQVQPVMNLRQVRSMSGRTRVQTSVDYGRQDNLILITGKTDEQQIRQVRAALGWSDDEAAVQAVLDDLHDQRESQAVIDLKNASSDAARLHLLVGDDRLMPMIPDSAIEFLRAERGGLPQGVALANLCIEMYGPMALEKACKHNKEGLALTPPSSFGGTYGARKFVKLIGFSEEWAGVKNPPKNKPTEYIDAPNSLGDFHDYQQQVSNNLRAMLRGVEKRRGLISLPTGAGKTRVAVQTIIQSISSGDLDENGREFRGPILWLADSEELCEQAIDAWSYLWRAYGRTDTQLVISRLWNRYNAQEDSSGVQVVVGTYQKVSLITESPEFDWLKETPLVVIDEAHTALAKSYTKILEWTGRGRNQRDKLLLGLSATPFRGREGSDETERLHKRFDQNFLDEGVFGAEDPLERLQRDKVLAKINLEVLHSDTFVPLTRDEIEDFSQGGWLPAAKSKELGEDVERTRRIIDSIKDKPEDWSILLFAASVENAQTLATLLTLDGIPAASIESGTQEGERKQIIDRFKRGELRVLTNYSVLSQGFDAPKTDAVYITRPTQSKVRYMQMIGRGLRGPRNGGTESVHLVNVLDNIQEFDLSIDYEYIAQVASSIEED